MKKRKFITLFALPILALLLQACGDDPTSQSSLSGSSLTDQTTSSDTTSVTSDDTSSSSTTSDDTSIVPPETIFQEALNKDYSNMTAAIDAAWSSGADGESYLEYYVDGYTIVYDENAALMGANPYLFYHDYNGEGYLYFEADRPNDPTSTPAWLSTGPDESIKYGIENTYFDMEQILENVTIDMVTYAAGLYIIQDPTYIQTLNETVFQSFWNNNIEYVTFTIDQNGYFASMIGLEEIDEDNDYVKVNFSSFGETTYPTTDIPEKPNEDNVMEYWEYKGWDGPQEDTYVESITLTSKKDLENNQLVLEIDEVVNATYTYLPLDASEAGDWTLVSSNEEVATIEFDFDDEDGNKQVKITGVGEGTCEVYIVAKGEEGIGTGVESNKIEVKVNPLKSQNLEGIVYGLSFTGMIDNSISVVNNQNNNLPVTVTGSNVSLNNYGGSYDLFDGKTALLMNGGSQGENPSVYFDFDDQQVSSLSFYYGAYFESDLLNKDYVESLVVETSNDGSIWTPIDVKDEVLDNISAKNLKLLEKEFEPASKVRITLDTNFVGKYFRFSFAEISFMANENCHDHEDIVDIPVASVSISSFNDIREIKVNETLQFSSLVEPSNATDKSITWHVEPESLASISSSGVLTPSGEAGEVTVYATANNGLVKSNEIVISIVEIPSVDSSILGSWRADDYPEMYELNVTDNNLVATINEESFGGEEDIHIVKELNYVGLVEEKYHFENEDGDYLNVIADSYSSKESVYVVGVVSDYEINLYTQNVVFTRYIPATSMSLSAEKTTLELEDTTTIEVSYNPITATGVGVDEITWSVDKEDVVTFYSDVTDASVGLYITASNPGQVKVTATNGDGVTASIDIIVNEPTKVESITLSTEGDVRSVEQYQSLQINATVVGENGETPYDSTLTWTSSNDEVLSVDDEGVVRGLQVSSDPVTITATANDGSGVYASIDITVVEGSGESIIPQENQGVYSGLDEVYYYEIVLTLEGDGSMTLIIQDIETTPTEFELVDFDGNIFHYRYNDQVVELEIRDSSTVWLTIEEYFTTAEGNDIYCFSPYIELTK